MEPYYKNVLVVTDNPPLLEFFQYLAKKFPQVRFSYAYSPRNKSPEKLIALGCNFRDVKKEAEQLASEFDLIFSLHCKQIFPATLVRSVKCINVHPGLNPYNRGWFPQVFSILNGLPLGATIHEMVEEIDRGPVIAQKEVEVKSWDTSLSAYQKVQKAEMELLENHLEKILRNEYSITETGDGNYNGINDFKALCQINLEEKSSYRDMLNRLRALTHEPYSNAWFLDEEGNKIFVSIKMEKASNPSKES